MFSYEDEKEKQNKTGMSDGLKNGMESLSGVNLSDVRVHRNSSEPGYLNAHAFAQGNQIHLAPGQEKHLPHEAWHVVQQKQGRVAATRQLKGIGINEDQGLEREADVMGAKALSMSPDQGVGSLLRGTPSPNSVQLKKVPEGAEVIQRAPAGIQHNPTTGMGELTGARGLRDDANQFQRQPNVTFTTQQLHSGEVAGHIMTARNLGPNHPQGSAPNPAASQNAMHDLSQLYPAQKFVRGHLLNGDIGGPGDARNLYPITSAANSHHYNYVERQVKSWINDDLAYVNYSVTANVINAANYVVDFVCDAYPVDAAGAPAPNSQRITKTIRSDPGVPANNGTADQNFQYNLGNALQEGAANMGDIEYQYGKLPAGYLAIPEEVYELLYEAMMKDRSMGLLEHIIGRYIGGGNSAEDLSHFIITGDDAIFQNMSTRAWNRMMNKMIDFSPAELAQIEAEINAA